ncbi:MAG TPA: GNAT family N-acetyltransferase [Vicinamibacteria bacterium]|nr:GNAT family N-acetyltransferase [Vicinamibacteria bacterium]
MLFASTSLAARVERAEARLMADGAAAAGRRHPATGVFAVPLAGGFATYTGPGSPLNKVAGLGFAGSLDEGELDAVEKAYAERSSPVQVELSCLADPSIGALLTRRGYTLVGFENVLGRPLPAELPATPGNGIEVSTSPREELTAWLDVVVTAFASPDAQGVPSHEQYPRETAEVVIGDMAAVAGLVRYLARRDGAAAGGASLRLSEGVAQLCGAATLPEHRRRGVQSALLAARLEVAAREGCDVAVVTTQPGSKSQENSQRQGFELLYTRAVLVRKLAAE